MQGSGGKGNVIPAIHLEYVCRRRRVFVIADLPGKPSSDSIRMFSCSQFCQEGWRIYLLTTYFCLLFSKELWLRKSIQRVPELVTKGLPLQKNPIINFLTTKSSFHKLHPVYYSVLLSIEFPSWVGISFTIPGLLLIIPLPLVFPVNKVYEGEN